MEKTLYSIGEVVNITGFTYRTIRYYGELDLVKPSWSEKGHKRCYTKDDIDKFFLIKRLRDLGFPLDRIKKIPIINTYLRKEKLPAKNIAPYIIEMLEEQLPLAKEKAERYTKLSNLLDEMLKMANSECINCDKDICEGNCFSKKFMEDYQIPDTQE